MICADFERVSALIAGAGTLGYAVRSLVVDARSGEAAVVRVEFVEMPLPDSEDEPAAAVEAVAAAVVPGCPHPNESRVDMRTMGRTKFYCRSCGETVEGV